jgi:hypothetical protein
MRRFHYINTGQISCEAAHPGILNVPVELAVNVTQSRNALTVYVAAKLIVMANRGSQNITLDYLCDEVALSERTVKRAIAELDELGFAKQTERWQYTPFNPGHESVIYYGDRPEIDEHEGYLSRIKDMYVFLESPWREYDEDGEEI